MKIKMNDYEVNHKKNTIFCGKTFMKNASKYGTDEYRTFIDMKRDFQSYDVVVVGPKKAEAKMSTKGLTKEFMELYITEKYGEDSQDYASFQGMKRVCGKDRSSYMTMRKWFTKKYPNWDGKQAKRDEVRQKKNEEKMNRAKRTYNDIEMSMSNQNT